MTLPRRRTAAEQLADHLRTELGRGRWTGAMPGQFQLAGELGIARNTAEAALRQLEREGILESQGPGRRRRIAMPSGSGAVRPLRVALLMMESSDRGLSSIVDLRHRLEEAGHVPFFPDKSLLDLGMEVGRVARLVQRTRADAWVVVAGSREVLEWFAAQPVPAFAMFGRRGGLPIAASGPNMPPAFAVVARRLLELGHHRISLIVRRPHRRPRPSAPVRAWIDELAANGISVGDFNLPDWEETCEGFHALLDSLFRVTPPTALFLDEAFLFAAAQSHLAARGLSVPRDVSLVCTEWNPTFAWCVPSVAHIRFDHAPTVRRIVRWAATVSRGGRDLRQHLARARFVPGGTLGPAPGR